MRSNTLAHSWLSRSTMISALAAISTCNVGAQATKPISGDPIVTDAGKVSGVVLENGVHGYMGVPFGAPPVGDLRWRAPAPVKPWTGVYDANELKAPCAQRGGGTEGEKPSEDCLYLNVWAVADSVADLPALLDTRVQNSPKRALSESTSPIGSESSATSRYRN